MSIIYQVLLIFIIFGGMSCTTTPWIKVRTEFYDQKQLASVAVDTPDPKKEHAYWGQRLLIQWNIGKIPTTAKQDSLLPQNELLIRVRLKNGKDKVEKRPLTGTSGIEYFTIDTYDYTHSGGVLSYHIELLQNGKVLQQSSHRLWVELINLSKPKSNY
jgi:hypothetical protein